jgi:hypothetical protein
MKPGGFTCELHFDASGILDGISRPDVIAETELLQKVMLPVKPENQGNREVKSDYHQSLSQCLLTKTKLYIEYGK